MCFNVHTWNKTSIILTLVGKYLHGYQEIKKHLKKKKEVETKLLYCKMINPNSMYATVETYFIFHLWNKTLIRASVLPNI